MKNICYQMSRKALLALVMVLSVSLPALAQKITVTGTVIDPDGEPLMGASVLALGMSGVGTSTNLDGQYRLEVNPDVTLQFSYIGYETQTVAVNGQTVINVTMKENSTVLGEVVAIGYGVVKKSDATGSVSMVKPDDIQVGIATSAQDILVGAAPGVVVTPDGGNPTGGATIRIRGGASLSASNDPLIVLDGVPLSSQDYAGVNPLTMVSPDNIESMTILKDASATAIYGSRASNGVIIITTKKGQSGRPQVNFSANFHLNTARKTWDVLDGPSFTKLINDKLQSAAAQLGTANTDWQKEVLRTSLSQDYNLSVGGTAGVLPYRLSASYTNSQGILKTSDMQRTTVGVSLTPKFFNGLLSVNANVKGIFIDNGDPGTGAIGAAVGFNPTMPVFANYPTEGNTGMYMFNGYSGMLTGNGTLNINGSTNPLALLQQIDNTTHILRSNGNLQIDYALHFLPDLHLNLNLGYDVAKNTSSNIVKPNSPQAWLSNYKDGAGTLYNKYELQRNTLLDFYANYRKEFEEIKSNVDVMAGYSWQRFDYHGRDYSRINTVGYQTQNIFNNNTYTLNVDPTTESHIGKAYGDDPNYINYWGAQLNLVSFFGRLNYTFDNKYLLTFTLRDDGTSRFSPDTRWAVFPALALGWKIDQMEFFEPAASVMNEFKLRLGWGKTGQQAVGGYFPYIPVYTNSVPSVSYPSPDGKNHSWINPLYPNAYNEKIKWEETTTWNVAFDMAWMNNRYTASIEWYMRDTNDLLAYVPVPAGMTTTDYMDRNIGSLRNIGVEANLSVKPVVTKTLTWTSALNVAWNKNKLTSLTGSSAEDQNYYLEAYGNPISANAGPIQVHKVGYPAASFRTLQQIYDQDGNPLPGQYVDQNGDGIINDDDLVINHSRDPKVTLAWNNTINYKNWDFGIMLRASIGNYVYDAVRARSLNIATANGSAGLGNLLKSDFYFNGSDLTSNLIRSDYFLENAGFLRCDNISAGYTFDNLLRNTLRLRVFGVVQNPFVITKYKGLDPEVFSGVDNDVYPRPVTVTLGLVATF